MRGSLDRLLPAMVATDLSVTDHVDDAHYIAAMGYASHDYPIASSLIRMYMAHDPGAVVEARKIARDMTKIAAKRQQLKLSASELADIGRQALEYVVNKRCPRCNGRKYELIPGTVCLGTDPCKACLGDGRRQLPKRHRKLIVEVIARIERVEGTLDIIVANRV